MPPVGADVRRVARRERGSSYRRCCNVGLHGGSVSRRGRLLRDGVGGCDIASQRTRTLRVRRHRQVGRKEAPASQYSRTASPASHQVAGEEQDLDAVSPWQPRQFDLLRCETGDSNALDALAQVAERDVRSKGQQRRKQGGWQRERGRVCTNPVYDSAITVRRNRGRWEEIRNGVVEV
jgi:hypothetical protein